MEYIVAKLVSGETIVGLANDMSENHIQLAYPFQICVDSYQTEDEIVSRSSLKSYCPYSDEQIMLLEISKTIYVMPLKASLVEAYKHMVDTYEADEDSEAVESLTDNTFYIEPSDTVQ